MTQSGITGGTQYALEVTGVTASFSQPLNSCTARSSSASGTVTISSAGNAILRITWAARSSGPVYTRDCAYTVTASSSGPSPSPPGPSAPSTSAPKASTSSSTVPQATALLAAAASAAALLLPSLRRRF
jgi:hypothetical protein